MGKFWFIAVMLVTLLLSGQAWAEKRVALVIGNSGYGDAIGYLKNPANDARLMAKSLRSVGFDVIERIDANQKQMKRAVRDFGDKLRSAGEDGVGLFYYAGHGVQMGGQNYLVPLKADINGEGDVDIEAVSAGSILAQMEYAGTRVNIVILDACRNNPFKRGFRSSVRGLARMDAPRGSYIAYATAPGDVAADGTGANSPFTTALAKAVTQRGVPLEQAFKLVRRDVQAATNKKQTPWTSSSLTGNFYFSGRPTTVAQPTPALQQQQAAPQQQADIVAWQSIQNSTNPEEFEAFILAFRDSPFAGIARVKMKALKKKQVAVVIPQPKPSPPPQQAQPAVGIFPKKITPGRTFKDCSNCPEMVEIQAGSFLMGSDSSLSKARPIHKVTISKPFAVGKYETTFAQWDACVAAGGCSNRPKNQEGISAGKDKGWGWGGGNLPVINVSWEDAKVYVRWLSGKTGKGYRLLSEAEWEYAARAGTSTKWSCGDQESCLDKVAWYGYEKSGKKTHPVGAKSANGFGCQRRSKIGPKGGVKLGHLM